MKVQADSTRGKHEILGPGQAKKGGCQQTRGLGDATNNWEEQRKNFQQRPKRQTEKPEEGKKNRGFRHRNDRETVLGGTHAVCARTYTREYEGDGGTGGGGKRGKCRQDRGLEKGNCELGVLGGG